MPRGQSINDRIPRKQSRSAAKSRRKVMINKRRKAPIRQRSQGMVRLSPCARAYAHTLMNPFEGPMGCVPSTPALLSRKVRVFARTTMTTGTNQFGFVCADPRSSTANGNVCLKVTTATYAGTTFDLATTPPTGVTDVVSNSDYATLGGTTGITVRPVGSGIRMRYAGTELNRGGIVVGLQDPNHNSLQGRTQANLESDINSKRFTVSRNWVTVLYKPAYQADTDFGNIVANTGAAADLCFFMGLCCTAPATAAAVFDVEFFTVFEAQGAAVRGTTISEVDETGFGAVQTALLRSNHLLPHEGPPKVDGFLADVGDVVAKGTSAVVSFASSPLAKEIASAGLYGLEQLVT